MDDRTILYIFGVYRRNDIWDADRDKQRTGRIIGLRLGEIRRIPVVIPDMLERGARDIDWYILHLDRRHDEIRQIPVAKSVDGYGGIREPYDLWRVRDWGFLMDATIAWTPLWSLRRKSRNDGELTDIEVKRIKWYDDNSRKLSPFYGLEEFLLRREYLIEKRNEEWRGE